jgi:hypothetical protein
MARGELGAALGIPGHRWPLISPVQESVSVRIAARLGRVDSDALFSLQLDQLDYAFGSLEPGAPTGLWLPVQHQRRENTGLDLQARASPAGTSGVPFQSL